MPIEQADNVIPGPRWAFDEAVTAAFDDMLARSIPQYDVMRRTVFDLARSFVRPNLAVVDLGCSRGEALAPFVEAFGACNRHVGIEVSAPMLAAARERFAGYVRSGVVEIREQDLRTSYPPVRACVTLSVLTLQFIPIEYRQQILRRAWKHTEPGGCFVLVEKVLGATAEADALFCATYRDLKADNGYTDEQIDRKRLSLEGVLVPVTARWNEELLRMAGFTSVDCFWRYLNFAGWIACKES